MKKIVFYSLSCFLITAFTQCKKSDSNNNNASCTSISNDIILMDGNEFSFAASQPTACAATTLNGTPGYVHYFSVGTGSGSTLNQPDINILFSSAPTPGTTTTFTIDDGGWQLASTPPPVGKVTFRMNNYQGSGGFTEYWFGDSQSGTINVSMDGAGNATFNFTDVKLVKSGGSLTDRKSVCGKNLICH